MKNYTIYETVKIVTQCFSPGKLILILKPKIAKRYEGDER